MLQSQKYDSSFLCALWLLLLNNRVQKKGVYSHIRSSHHIPTGGWKSLEKKGEENTICIIYDAGLDFTLDSIEASFTVASFGS